jgi:hypothetical protein
MAKQKVCMCCSSCGGENVVSDAYAAWDVEAQQWTISSVFDKGAYCEDCDGETRIVEKPSARTEDSHATQT